MKIKSFDFPRSRRSSVFCVAFIDFPAPHHSCVVLLLEYFSLLLLFFFSLIIMDNRGASGQSMIARVVRISFLGRELRGIAYNELYGGASA